MLPCRRESPEWAREGWAFSKRIRRLTSSRLIFPSLSLSKWSTAALILLAV